MKTINDNKTFVASRRKRVGPQCFDAIRSGFYEPIALCPLPDSALACRPLLSASADRWFELAANRKSSSAAANDRPAFDSFGSPFSLFVGWPVKQRELIRPWSGVRRRPVELFLLLSAGTGRSGPHYHDLCAGRRRRRRGAAGGGSLQVPSGECRVPSPIGTFERPRSYFSSRRRPLGG